MALLQTLSLSKNFGSGAKHRQALHHFDFILEEGQITALLGPNGAGKTTLLRLLLQILQPSSGQIVYAGVPLKRKHLALMGYLPEERGLYPHLSIAEQLLFLGKLRGLKRAQILESLNFWVDRLEFQGKIEQKMSTLSKGMAQKIQFIAAVLHHPACLVLDEPYSGLDPLATTLLQRQILYLQQEGTSILLASHQLENLEKQAKNLVLLHQGQKIIQADITDLRTRFAPKNINEIFVELLNTSHVTA